MKNTYFYYFISTIFNFFRHTRGTVRTLTYKPLSAKWCAYVDVALCPFWQVYNPTRQEMDRSKKEDITAYRSQFVCNVCIVPKHSPFFSSCFNHSAFSADPTCPWFCTQKQTQSHCVHFLLLKKSWWRVSGKEKHCLFLGAPAVSSKGESWSFSTLSQEVLSCNSTSPYTPISKVMGNTLLHTNIHYYQGNWSSVFYEPKIK